MTPMTTDDRNELSWVKGAKIVRLGVYEVGLLLGALLAGLQIDKAFGDVSPWPDYPLSKLFLLAGLSLWVSMIFRFNEDRKSIKRIDDLLERDDLDRDR